jgi:hypothetical protein
MAIESQLPPLFADYLEIPARAGSKVYFGTYTVFFVGVKTTLKFKVFHCVGFGTTLATVASESIFGIALR